MKALDIIIGAITGTISGFGIGGGSLLVLYLTAISGLSQYKAGGINLLYFIGCAPPALIGHIHNRQVNTKTAIWCILGGIATAIPVSLLAGQLETDLLRRMFGALVIYIAIREWRQSRTTQ